MKRFQTIIKTFLLVFVLVFLLSGCDTDTDEAKKDKTPTDIKTPGDEKDPVDKKDPVVVVGEPIALAVGTLYDGTNSSDGELYSISIDAPSYYRIKSTGDLKLEGKLSDSNGTELAFNDHISFDNSNFEIIVYLEPATYSLEVTTFQFRTSGTYQIMVEALIVSHPETIAKNSLVEDILFKGETNAIEFVVPNAGDVTLYTESNFDTYGTVYDSNGNVVRENDNGSNGDDFYISVFLESGTYTLEVTGIGDYVMEDYELFYNFVEDSVVYRPISLDSFETGSSEAFGTEYFVITITETVTVNIYSTGSVDMEGELYRTKAGMIPFEYNDDASSSDYNFLLENVTLEPGEYYLHAISLDYSAPSYQIHLDIVE